MLSYPPKFQPGDTVTIRTWDDMLSQYGSRKGSGIKTPYITFSYDMKQYCGRSFKSKMSGRQLTMNIGSMNWTAAISLLPNICSFYPYLFLLLPFPLMTF